MPKFEINSQFDSSEIIYECNLTAEEARKDYRIRLGIAVKKAIKEGASLANADLTGARLTSSIFANASLASANLSGANLEVIKKDFMDKLAIAKNEVLALYDYLMRGKINGSVYEGECACFCGTVANIRKEKYDEMFIDLGPNEYSPTERWFRAIREGDTPQNNQVAAITAEWMKDFMDKKGIKYQKYEIVAISEELEG